jgi:hypothetical protein
MSNNLRKRIRVSNPKSASPFIWSIDKQKSVGFLPPKKPLFVIGSSISGSDEVFEIILRKKAEYKKPSFLLK